MTYCTHTKKMYPIPRESSILLQIIRVYIFRTLFLKRSFIKYHVMLSIVIKYFPVQYLSCAMKVNRKCTFCLENFLWVEENKTNKDISTAVYNFCTFSQKICKNGKSTNNIDTDCNEYTKTDLRNIV